MFEKLDTQTRSFGCTLDHTGDIGNHEAAVLPGAHHAQIRVKRGEGVVCDLRTGTRNRSNQTRLAGVRQPQKADIRQQHQLHVQCAALARGPVGRLPRRTVGTALEMDVAQAMSATARHQQLVAVRHHLADELLGVGIEYARPDRHADVDTLALVPGHLPPHAILPALGAVMALMAEIDQRIEATVGHQEHMTTVTTVTAIRAAFGNKLLAAKTYAAVPAVAGLDLDNRLIDKLHRLFAIPSLRNARAL